MNTDNMELELYEDLAGEIIAIFSLMVRQKKQVNAENLAEIFKHNRKISQLIQLSQKKLDMNKYKGDESSEKHTEEIEKLRKSLRETKLEIDRIEEEGNKKIETCLSVIRTISIMAKTPEETISNSIIKKITENLKSSGDMNRELVESQLRELREEIVKSDINGKAKDEKPKETRKKSLFAGIFKTDRQNSDNTNEEDIKNSTRELLSTVILRLEIKNAEGFNQKIQQVIKNIKKEDLSSSMERITSDICELIGEFREKTEEEKNNLYKVMEEIVTRLIDTEKEMIFSFSGNQSESEKHNREFHESFEQDVTGIEKSFEKTSVEEIKNLVFGKLNNIKTSLKKKKEIDRKLHDDAMSYISRLQDDLKKNETDIKKIQDMAELDSLTGIYNRGAFQHKLKQEYNKFKESKTPCSLIVFDIDTFKKINELYTYDNGDRILQTIAKLIKEKIPEKYIFARYGGGEFIMILPGVDLEQSKQSAEKTRKLITDIDFYHRDQKVPVTISLGVVEFQEKLNSLQILQKAHECMKSAKKKGGNQVSYQ